MKILLKISLFLIVSAYLVIMLGFTGKQYENRICRGMVVIVRDSLERGLISSGDVKSMIRLEYGEVAGSMLHTLNVAGIEESLNRIPAIACAQVYTDIQGRLMVEIRQRSPVARIEDWNHQHYFLDGEGYVIPANMDYTPYILYINGNIPGKYRKQTSIASGNPAGSHSGVRSGSPAGEVGGADEHLMEDILKLAVYIRSDPFWRSQIVQVYVNERREFELIPRLGSQIILFGNAERMKTKFFKLETLYREGFSNTGWNQYEIINLKYRDQVICTKR
jgi:cell division protein FtsQ